MTSEIVDTQTLSPEESIAKSIVPSDTALAYMAGFLDGEGSIKIKRQMGKYNPSFSLVVEATNTVRSVIDYIQEQLGGGIYIHEKHTVNLRTLYQVSWCARAACEVLELLLPYLIVKREQAELGIAFQGIVDSKDCFLGRATPLTKTELAVREIFYARARELKTE